MSIITTNVCKLFEPLMKRPFISMYVHVPGRHSQLRQALIQMELYARHCFIFRLTSFKNPDCIVSRNGKKYNLKYRFFLLPTV